MANDITTLAIEIQSQEAERNLRTFNELLILSSQTASKMDKVRIDVDVKAALAQIQALKAGYDDLAACAQNIHFDTGPAPEAVAAPAVDSEALNALKDFFASSAEMSRAFREEMERFNEAIAKLEADTMKVASAGGKNTTSMRGAATVSREYAAALRELIAAQKEMEKAIAKSDADMGRVVAADADADAVKKKLIAAQRELKQTRNNRSVDFANSRKINLEVFNHIMTGNQPFLVQPAQKPPENRKDMEDGCRTFPASFMRSRNRTASSLDNMPTALVLPSISTTTAIFSAYFFRVPGR